MKLLHIGCSWSQISNWNYEYSSPIIELQQSLKTLHNIDVTTYSANRGGTSLDMHLDLLLQTLNLDIKYNGIIFQVTAGNRGYIQTNKQLRLSIDDFEEFNNLHDNSNYILQRWLGENYCWFSPGAIGPDENTTLHNLAKKYRKIKSTASTLDLQLDYLGNILTAKKIMQATNIPYIIYAHTLDSQWWSKPHIRDLVHQELDFVVKEQVDSKKYIIDNGDHFNYEGNKEVAEKLLLPLALKRFTS